MKNAAVELTENPFYEEYVAELVHEEMFVNLFSDSLVESCLMIFGRGNVILSGIEGSGKSMLLNLLKPQIRIAYSRKGVPFPVPGSSSKFLGAGINLTRSQAIDVGSRIVTRALVGGSSDDAPLFFGDFLNYWLVRDIIDSVQLLANRLNLEEALESVGIEGTDEKFDDFAKRMSKKPAWSGALQNICSLSDLHEALDKRIALYRKVVTELYPEPIPKDIHETLTEVGEPVSQTVEALRESGILQEDVPVLLRIDQYEDLVEAKDFDRKSAERFREVVNKFLWTRDPNVFYKLGGRKYALGDSLRVFGLGEQCLEENRHYRTVDLDDILRRPENSASWLFPSFAESVFKKRLETAGYPVISLLQFFGSTMKPNDKASLVAKEDSRPRALGDTRSLPEDWRACLTELSRRDLLTAKLGYAWALQRQARGELESAPSCDGTKASIKELPWERRRWWKKERVQQALLQASSNAGQRVNWSGKQDILTLSGGNVLIFLDICSSIWSVWAATIESRNSSGGADFGEKPVVAPNCQSAGIYSASNLWYRKVMARTKGDSRKRLIDMLGHKFYNSLKADLSMSYPGHNGFSIEKNELNSHKIVKSKLQEAVRYGDLVELSHTPKSRNSGKRTKWYLLPILSPYFNLPASHTKEPLYVRASEVEGWLAEAQKEAEEELRKGLRE